MTRVVREVQAAYDQIVRAYAERNDGVVPAALIPYGENLVKHAGKAARVIDIGCGTGRDMAWLESQGVAVTGIDLSCEMLRYARGKVRGDLFAMEMTRLGFRDGCFDAAFTEGRSAPSAHRDPARAQIGKPRDSEPSRRKWRRLGRRLSR